MTESDIAAVAEQVQASLDFLYNWADGRGRSECVAEGRAAFATLVERLEAAERERDGAVASNIRLAGEVVRLREALERVAGDHDAQNIARDALAPQPPYDDVPGAGQPTCG